MHKNKTHKEKGDTMERPFLRSYWVLEYDFLAGYTPASLDTPKMLRRLQALLDCGIRSFVNLQEPDEKDYEGMLFAPYQLHLYQLAGKQNIFVNYHNIPIKDRDIPSINQMHLILDTINSSLARKLPVYVHCWGGKGRTGTVVGCWLVQQGLFDGQGALQQIKQLRRNDPKKDDPSPETPEQVDFVLNWMKQTKNL